MYFKLFMCLNKGIYPLVFTQSAVIVIQLLFYRYPLVYYIAQENNVYLERKLKDRTHLNFNQSFKVICI